MKYATGAVLTQLDGNGDRHPISFISKTFSPSERNYDIYNRELLAIIRALDEWRHYIQGSHHTTTILCDHKNLTYYREAKKLTRRQARWSLYLSEFDIKLVHTPGTKMILSDALSRRPDFCPDEDHDNEDVVMLPDHMFLQLIDLDLQQKIALSDTLDQQALDALTFLLNDSLTIPSSLKQDIKDWTVHMDDTYFIKEKPTFLGTTTFEGILFVPFMITLLRDIPASWGHITLSDNITGGWVYERSLKTTSKVAASVNNSRSIVPP